MEQQTVSFPFFTPGFIAAAVAFIGFVAWLIRLEAKVNALQKDSSDHAAHVKDKAIHFDQRLAAEVEQRKSDRMTRIESDVKEIKDMVKEMAGK